MHARTHTRTGVHCAQVQRLLAAETWRHAGPTRGLMTYLDAQQAKHGLLDPRFSLLRPCTVHLLCMGPGPSVQSMEARDGTAGSAGAAGGQEGRFPQTLRALEWVDAGEAFLGRMHAELLAQRVRLAGGEVAQRLHPGVTHVVVVCRGVEVRGCQGAGQPQCVQPFVHGQGKVAEGGARHDPSVCPHARAISMPHAPLPTLRPASLLWPRPGRECRPRRPDACGEGGGRWGGCCGCAEARAGRWQHCGGGGAVSRAGDWKWCESREMCGCIVT
jgi:hypothetical protein